MASNAPSTPVTPSYFPEYGMASMWEPVATEASSASLPILHKGNRGGSMVKDSWGYKTEIVKHLSQRNEEKRWYCELWYSKLVLPKKKKKFPSMNTDIHDRNFITATKRTVWKGTGKENNNCQLDYPLWRKQYHLESALQVAVRIMALSQKMQYTTLYTRNMIFFFNSDNMSIWTQLPELKLLSENKWNQELPSGRSNTD